VKKLLTILFITLFSLPVFCQAIEGFGSQAIGGANSSTVYHVTNLNSSGAGSFANGIGSNKTIVFDVSGTIVGRFNLVNISFLTIDATGRSITINNNNNGDGISFGVSTHHCILKNVRVINAGEDGINVIDDAHDIAIVNCTSRDNGDGNIDVAGDDSKQARNVTIQYCLLGRGKTTWGGAMLITGQNVSIHHNLFSPATINGVGERCPLVHCNYSPAGNPNADIRNNLVWKFGRSNGTGSGFGIDVAYGAKANAIANYVYTTGGSNSNGVTTSAYGEPSGFLFASANVSGNNGTNANAASNANEIVLPMFARVQMQSACAAAFLVKNNAGARPMDDYDLSIVNSINLFNCPGTTPVTWLSFFYKDNPHRLEWSTATEINNDRFELEESDDGINFRTIAIVKSKATDGNSDLVLSYSYNL
jgi:hypothetical protein